MGVCTCIKKQKQNGNGYPNLLSQIQSSYPNKFNVHCISKHVNRYPFQRLLYSAKSIQVHSCLIYVIKWFEPFSVFEDTEIVKLVRYQQLLVHSFIKYLGRLTGSVERNIFKCLQISFVCFWRIVCWRGSLCGHSRILFQELRARLQDCASQHLTDGSWGKTRRCVTRCVWWICSICCW